MPSSRPNSARLFSLPALLLLLVLAASALACDVNAWPPHAVNLVGESHTVDARLDERNPDVEWFAFFFVLFGPNEGQNSLTDCGDDAVTCTPPGCEPTEPDDPDCLIDCNPLNPVGEDCLLNCEPSGCVADGDDEISWTYDSNGRPGRDYIVVCGIIQPESASLEAMIDTLARQGATLQQTEEEIEEFIAYLDSEFGCASVTKDWKRPTPTPKPTETSTPTLTPIPTETTTPTPTATPGRPNLSGLAGAILQATGATPIPSAQLATQPLTQQVAPIVVLPPRTGDGALR